MTGRTLRTDLRARSGGRACPDVPAARLLQAARGTGWLVAALLLVLTALPAQAQRVRAYVSKDTVRVGDRFFLTLVAEHDPLVEPAFPEPTDSLLFGDLEVLAQRTRARYDQGHARIDSVVYEVTTFSLDTAFVPPIPIGFAADADTFSVATGAFIVPVASLVPPNAQGVRDLAPIVEFPAPIWPWILLVAGVLLVAGLLGYAYWRRRKRRAAMPEPSAPPRILTPYEEAVERLEQLEQFDLERPEMIKAYYVDLSDVLRHYLARRTGVNAMESTTRELVRELGQRSGVPTEGVVQVRGLLELADYVKFADGRPPAERNRAALAETRETIERIERALRRHEVAAERPAAETPEHHLTRAE